jgi:DNA-binding Lrp family transcriptional regulator
LDVKIVPANLKIIKTRLSGNSHTTAIPKDPKTIYVAFNAPGESVTIEPREISSQNIPGTEAVMVTAMVLIECEKGAVNQAAQTLASLQGISEVYSVAGRVDLVAIIRVHDNESLAQIVTEKMLHVPGITRTETLIAFQVYSRHDLESMFSIGM